MGFNKRFVEKETIELYLKKNKSLSNLFKADALIFMDKVSSKVYEMYCSGTSDIEIKNKWKEILSENE